MLELDTEELRTKLADWVLNAHLPELFGIHDDHGEIKNAFEDLVTRGILLKDGNRRGLKFKFNTEYKPDEGEALDVNVQGALLDVNAEEVKEVKQNDVHVYIKERDNIKSSVNECQRSFEELLQWVLGSKPDRDPSIVSNTLSIKKMTDGSVIMRVYSGMMSIINEEFPSVEAFTRAMKKLNKTKELKNVKE